MSSACVACPHCLPPFCHPWGRVSLTVGCCLSLTSGSFLCSQRDLAKAHVLSCPFFFFFFKSLSLSITAVSSTLPGLQPNPLLCRLSWLLALAPLSSLLVSEITGRLVLILTSLMFSTDLLLALWWSLSWQHGYYPELVREVAPDFVLSMPLGNAFDAEV